MSDYTGRHRPVIDPDHHPLRLADRPGYGRPKPTSAYVSQMVWLVIGIVGAAAFSGETNRVLAFVIPAIALASIGWIEWSERCEDQRKVNRVFAVIMVVLAAFIVHNHNERRDR